MERVLGSLPAEEAIKKYLMALQVGNTTLPDRTRCAAVEWSEMRRWYAQLWRRAGWELREGTGCIVCLVNPQKAWSSSILFSRDPRPDFDCSGMLLPEGFWEIQGENNLPLGAAYAGCADTPGEGAVCMFLAAVSFSALRMAIEEQPPRLAVHAGIRGERGLFQLY